MQRAGVAGNKKAGQAGEFAQILQSGWRGHDRGAAGAGHDLRGRLAFLLTSPDDDRLQAMLLMQGLGHFNEP